uniref:nuclear cap-binding protein subunit 3-like isoform X1 n=1 Tax=Styela clava TaxID=7725 RepID=UPI0019393C34|nr:nuclear cap-binding protein subunit 3-like isoform X1 [Styela clava]
MSDAEVEVIEVKASNTLVPNLTISVDQDENQGDEPIVEFQEEDEEVTEVKEEKDSVEFKLETKSFPHTKIYENKLLKEMGLTAEEAKLRKQTRAQRFQSPLLRGEIEPEDNELDAVKNLIAKIEKMNEEGDILKSIRLDAIHLRGLDDMSTEDIFSFFSDHFPSHIEWIDDTSCNVVWKDTESAASALLKMTKPYKSRTKSQDGANESDKTKEGSETKGEAKDEDDDLDLMETDEEMEVDEGNTEKDSEQKQLDKVNGDFKNELRRCKRPFLKGERKVLLKMRLANVNDKKTLGGAKKSHYYRRYGNPNYGNMRGLLSRSFMKRYHGRVAKREYSGYKPETDEAEHDIEEEHESAKKYATKKRQMYSEEEWSNAKKARKNDGETSSGSSESESEEDNEKEDRDLINSSAKDLDDAIPVQNNEDSFEITEEDTMRADRIAKKIEAARRSQENASLSGNLNVQVRGNSVWGRLGKKPDPDVNQVAITIKNERKERSLRQDVEIKNKLPKSLQNRLGSKRS